MMGFLDDDSRGFLISLDLLIAIIPLTIIMGMMVTDMDNVLYTVQNTVYQSSLERVGADTVNTLIKTPGSPYNWEEIGSPKVIGLAKYDVKKGSPEANYLSPNKLASVKVSDIVNLTGTGYGYYLNITTVDDNRVIKQMGTNSSVPNVPNIVRIERIVLTSNLELSTSLEGLIRDAGQSRTYTTNFPTNLYSTQVYDYWILVINHGYPSATIDVNNNNVLLSNEFNQSEIKKKINNTFMHNSTTFQDNIVNVRTDSSPGASMDVYVIAAPPGTSKDEINLDNAQLRECRFVFYIWTV